MTFPESDLAPKQMKEHGSYGPDLKQRPSAKIVSLTWVLCGAEKFKIFTLHLHVCKFQNTCCNPPIVIVQCHDTFSVSVEFHRFPRALPPMDKRILQEELLIKQRIFLLLLLRNSETPLYTASSPELFVATNHPVPVSTYLKIRSQFDYSYC